MKIGVEYLLHKQQTKKTFVPKKEDFYKRYHAAYCAGERKVAKAMKLMRNRATGVHGALTRAARMITSEDELDTKPTMVEELKRLHPEGKQVVVTVNKKCSSAFSPEISRKMPRHHIEEYLVFTFVPVFRIQTT